MRTALHTLLLRAALLCALLASLPCAQAAQVYRVDDAGTRLSDPIVRMRWRQLVPGRSADPYLEGSVRADVRLNLAAWLNRPARIYMGLAPMAGGQVQVQWTTQGRLLAGSVLSGERTLVFSGMVNTASFTESLLLSMVADSRQIGEFQQLNFYFEIEVLP